jgi:hypothetical protein
MSYHKSGQRSDIALRQPAKGAETEGERCGYSEPGERQIAEARRARTPEKPVFELPERGWAITGRGPCLELEGLVAQTRRHVMKRPERRFIIQSDNA